jgi:CRP-like cAMP-binding protein
MNQHQLSPAALEGWRVSFLGSRLSAAADSLLEGSIETYAEAGEVIYQAQSSKSGILIVVVDGLLRIFTTREMRQATVAYRSNGDVTGLPTLLAPRVVSERIPLAVQAMTDVHLLNLSTDLLVAGAVYEEFAKVLFNSYEILAENVFLPVRQRVARHLLDLSVRSSGVFCVSVSQQDIADAIGSVREVVSRAILRLRDEGLIKRGKNCYLLLDPAGLHRVARGSD